MVKTCADPANMGPSKQMMQFGREIGITLDAKLWVGDDREVTDTDVLRPTVAKKAYAGLGLWAWERDWLVAMGMELPDGERLDAALARTGLSRWRTAAD